METRKEDGAYRGKMRISQLQHLILCWHRTPMLLTGSFAPFCLFPPSVSLFFSLFFIFKMDRIEISFRWFYSPNIFKHRIGAWTQTLITACLNCWNIFSAGACPPLRPYPAVCPSQAPNPTSVRVTCLSKISEEFLWPRHCSCILASEDKGKHFSLEWPALQAWLGPHPGRFPLCISKAWFLSSPKRAPLFPRLPDQVLRHLSFISSFPDRAVYPQSQPLLCLACLVMFCSSHWHYLVAAIRWWVHMRKFVPFVFEFQVSGTVFGT